MSDVDDRGSLSRGSNVVEEQVDRLLAERCRRLVEDQQLRATAQGLGDSRRCCWATLRELTRSSRCTECPPRRAAARMPTPRLRSLASKARLAPRPGCSRRPSCRAAAPDAGGRWRCRAEWPASGSGGVVWPSKVIVPASAAVSRTRHPSASTCRRRSRRAGRGSRPAGSRGRHRSGRRRRRSSWRSRDRTIVGCLVATAVCSVITSFLHAGAHGHVYGLGVDRRRVVDGDAAVHPAPIRLVHQCGLVLSGISAER